MFTVEIRINGTLISHIHGHNEMEVVDGKDRYSFEHYAVESRKVKRGEVWHDRNDGIDALVAKILGHTKRKGKT